MQIFTCPFCGPRDETEFHFGAEAGRCGPNLPKRSARKTGHNICTRRPIPRGSTREIWVHTTCGEFFAMARDTVSHEVTASDSLRRETKRVKK
ncbi:MAG: sarcosine oxidase subunit delta [Nitratireductor sp.]